MERWTRIRAVLSNDPDHHLLVGTAGLEPATSASRTLRATKLRYVPMRVMLGAMPGGSYRRT